jgi:hypothetical protein
MTRLLILLTTISLLFISSQATFAASVTITPASNGIFIIQGNQMDGVAGIELNVVYDSSSLASPSVNQGNLISGAIMLADTNIPGSIKVAIISTKAFSGSGQIVSISFATHTGSGSIKVSSSMINSKGAPVPGGGSSVASDFQTISTTSTTGDTTNNTTNNTTSGSTTGSGAGVSIPTYLGTVSMPADVQARSESKPADASGVPAQIPEPADSKPIEPPAETKPVAEPQKPVEVKMTSYKGALDNFREYRGERSPAIFIALFNKEITPTVRQEPAVALSDGKTPLKLRVKLETASDKSPNFSLNGAKLVSLNRDTSAAWIIDAFPQAGIMRASLTIMTDSDIIEYPLTLAPPINDIAPAEADFAVFLKDSGAATPKRDLNGDGIHDYLDDFIYTANYLVNKAAASKIKK